MTFDGDIFDITDSTTYSVSEGADDTTTNDVDGDDTSTIDTAYMIHHPAAAVQLPADEETTVEEDDDDETTTIVANVPMDDATTSDDEDMTTTDDTLPAPASANDLPPYCSVDNCHNRSARDCANAACGRCCVLRGHYACLRHQIS